MAVSRNINCWEFMKCSKDVYRDCPAFPTGGRICYMIAGTLCGGKPQGGYAEKSKECIQCDFYVNEILNGRGPGAAGRA